MTAIRTIVATLLLLCSMLQSVHAADWNIDRLMQSLAEAKSGRATFVEKKFIAQLDRPIESSGELRYIAPDRLEKHTIKPKVEDLIVQGDTLTVERGNRKHTVQMQEYPELAGAIDSIRGTLAGDRKVLERSFSLALEGNAERWMLVLKPTNVAIARNVHLIRIAGMRNNVRSIEVIQTDGDRSQMTIERVASS